MKKKLLVSVLALALGIVLLAFNCYGSYGSKSLDESSGSQLDRGVINAGLFYVNNKGTGHYLKYNSAVSGESGLLSNLGTYIKWYFYETSNGYTIHPNNASGDMYLALTTDGTGVEVISTNEYREYPERCYWNLYSTSYGYLLRGRFIDANNTTAYKYLQDTGTGFQLISDLPTSGTLSYNQCEWRIVSTSDYGSTSSYTYRELGSSFSINAIQMYVEDLITPFVNPYPSNAIWADASDFVYTETSQNPHLIIDGSTIKGKKPGSVTVTATHKVTGRTKTFSVTVNILPVSGSEISYNPSLWTNSNVCGNTNCYAYAIDSQLNPDTNELWIHYIIIMGEMIIDYVESQPGLTRQSPQSNTDSSGIYSNVMADTQHWGISFGSASRTSACPTGSYKIAIVIAPGIDYHFYRQNPDGTWSHKRGNTTNVSILDASNQIIYDPQYADQAYPGCNYSQFVGYYYITPLSLYYSGTRNSTVICDVRFSYMCLTNI